MKTLWMVAYDIVDNKQRSRVFNILKNCGEPVQYSVFECWLTRRQLDRVRERVKEHLGEEDQVRWYPLCSWCRDRIFWQGRQRIMPEDRGFTLL